MKKSERTIFSLVFSVALICLMAAAIVPGVMGASAVDLGSAGNYAILAKAGITTTGTTSIIGNIGVSPIAATGMTGFGLVMDLSNQFSKSSLVSGNVYASDYAAPTPARLTIAVNDMQAAYTDGAGQAPDATELGAGNIGGMTLAPGVYKWSTGVTIPTDVTLSGSSKDVWIFEIAQNLVVSSGQHVVLRGGAQAKNIFWVVAGQTTLGTGSVFNGNILDQTAIVLNTGATLNGRALAQTAVTLDANTVTGAAGASAPSNSVMTAPSNGASGTSVNLGSAANYAILAQTGITTTPGTRDTRIYGNVGVSPMAASSMTGFGLVADFSNLFSKSSLVNGNVYASDYAAPTPATMTAAVNDMATAYTAANAQTPSVTELGSGSIDKMTLAPGVYKWSTGVTIPSSVTLDAQGNPNAVWVFQIAGVLSSGVDSHVILTGGAQAQNVYWVVAGNTALGANSAFNGNILDQTNIALGNGATLNGRALAQTAVTLIGNTVTNPTAILAPSNSASGTPVNLGTAANYAILTKSGITTTPGTQNTRVYGNIGVSPIAASSITGFGLVADFSNLFSTSPLVNGNVYASDYAAPTPATMTAAVSDMQAAYTAGNAQAPGVTELGGGNIDNMTLAPGVYKWSTGVTIPTGVTLDAQGNPNAVWVFQIAGVLSTGADSQVILTGGAQPQNVYWVVAGNTALGANSAFNGNILDQTNIALGDGATLNGRALAQTAVTLIGNTVTNPTAILAPSNGASGIPVNLGTAVNYAILTKSGITTTPGTQDTRIYGNIGVSPIAASSMTGFGLVADSSGHFAKSPLVNGNVYAADYTAPTPATMTTAVSDMEAAYTTANAQAPGVTELGGGSIDKMTLAPGVYKWSTGVTIPNRVTLDAQGNPNAVWVFQIAGILSSGVDSHVVLRGGAQAQNVYWVVAGNTALGANSKFNGNILDQTSISLGDGAILNGRALAQTAVTLNGNTVTSP
jgi:predicted acyltransferase (DUF342 family)